VDELNYRFPYGHIDKIDKIYECLVTHISVDVIVEEEILNGGCNLTS